MNIVKMRHKDVINFGFCLKLYIYFIKKIKEFLRQIMYQTWIHQQKIIQKLKRYI